MANQNVHLQVKSAQSPTPTAFTICQNNSSYMYKYTGGNPTGDDPSGSFNFTHGGGQKTVDIDLISSSGFTISKVQIDYAAGTGANSHDLSDAGNPDGTWTITDTNVHQESGTFEVYVDNGTTATNIECDPRWENN